MLVCGDVKQSEATEALDVVLLGFAEGRDETPVAGLQRVFGIESAAAERLLARVPTVVQRGVSPVRAAYFLRALNLIGARAEARDAHGQAVPLEAPKSMPPAARVRSVAPVGDALPDSALPSAAVSNSMAAEVHPPEPDPAPPNALFEAPLAPARRTQLAYGGGPARQADRPPRDGVKTMPETEPRTGERTLLLGGEGGAGAVQDAAHASGSAYAPTLMGEVTLREHAGASVQPLTARETPARESFGSARPAPADIRLPTAPSTLDRDILAVVEGESNQGTRAVAITSDGHAHGPPHASLDHALAFEPRSDPSGSGAPPSTAPSFEPASLPPGRALLERALGVCADEPSRDGLSLPDALHGDLQVMGNWDAPGDDTLQRYEHPMVPRGRALELDDGREAPDPAWPEPIPPPPAASLPSIGPSERSRQEPFYPNVMPALITPFVGSGTYWIVLLCGWSAVTGVLSAVASWLPGMLALAGYGLVLLAGLGLFAASADFFGACFWAAADGGDEVERAPSVDPGRILDEYLRGGLQLGLCGLLGLLPVVVWGVVRLRGDAHASDLMRSTVTWMLLGLPLLYAPMAQSTIAVGHRFSAVWSLARGLSAIARAPLPYLLVVAIGLSAMALSGLAFVVLSAITGQGWLLVLGAGFPLAVGAGIQGALMGHLCRVRPSLFD